MAIDPSTSTFKPLQHFWIQLAIYNFSTKLIPYKHNL